MIDVFQPLTLLGLAAMTVLTRCFFFILNRELPFPAWAQRGLQYAPIAALAAVVVPEVMVTQGHLISTCLDRNKPMATNQTRGFGNSSRHV